MLKRVLNQRLLPNGGTNSVQVLDDQCLSHLQNLRPFSKPRRILICADNRADMDTDKAMCWRAYNMTCLDAVAITIVSLANTPNAEVVVCTFGKEELVNILTKFYRNKHGVIHLKKIISEVSSHYVTGTTSEKCCPMDSRWKGAMRIGGFIFLHFPGS